MRVEQPARFWLRINYGVYAQFWMRSVTSGRVRLSVTDKHAPIRFYEYRFFNLATQSYAAFDLSSIKRNVVLHQVDYQTCANKVRYRTDQIARVRARISPQIPEHPPEEPHPTQAGKLRWWARSVFPTGPNRTEPNLFEIFVNFRPKTLIVGSGSVICAELWITFHSNPRESVD